MRLKYYFNYIIIKQFIHCLENRSVFGAEFTDQRSGSLLCFPNLWFFIIKPTAILYNHLNLITSNEKNDQFINDYRCSADEP